jgi:L-asparaginase II
VGIALKVRDGGQRATGPVLIAVLRSIDVLDDTDVEALAEFAAPAVLGGGSPVGDLEVAVDLAPAG